MKIINPSILLIILFSVSSCSNDSSSDLTGLDKNIPLTYNNTIRFITASNCIECHKDPPINGAPMPLLTYENVKNAILTRGLINRISSTDPNFSMPFGRPRLPQDKIDQIKKWADEGFPE